MKNITLLAVTIVAITFASCKKERECVCTSTSSGATLVTTTKIKSGKKDAESWCSALQGDKSTATVNGVAATLTPSGFTCKIK